MLENEQIRLRALEPSDVALLYRWENDPAHWKVSHTVTPYSRHTLSEYIQATGDIYTDKQLRLILELLPHAEAIGTVDLFECDFKNRRVGMGVLIADATRRAQGIGSMVLELILPYCFDTIGMHQVYCNVLADNDQSMALFEKYGFKRVGLKKEWTWYQGAFYDEWLLQKLAHGPEAQ
jgi:diamine N-acetyltransferase